VIYGASNAKAGAVHSVYQLLTDPRLNHRCQKVCDVLANECGQLLSASCQARRAEGKK